MDRSFDFRRRANYWQSLMHTSYKGPVDDAVDHKAIDRFSLISSSVFTQLHTLDALLTPYVTTSATVTSGKEHIGASIYLPRVKNVVSYIQAKRNLFEKTDIKDIVNDTRVAGDLVKQMKASIEEQPRKGFGKNVSKHLHEHRLGVIACLQYVLKSVQTSVEEYERYRLNTETNVNMALGIMMENRMNTYSLLTDQEPQSPRCRRTIPKEYISLFIDPRQENKTMMDDSTPKGDESAASTPTALSRQASFSLIQQSRKGHQVPLYKNPLSMELVEPLKEGEEQVMLQEHKAIVRKVHESIQMSELNTINSVQQRLSEISSMFEQFSGTLAVQLDMFECINANVMESLSNIESTETTLQNKEKENMPYHQLLMCYAFVSCAIFLLLVDFLKSHHGHYLF